MKKNSDNLVLTEQAACGLIANRNAAEELQLEGDYLVEHWRNGVKIGEYAGHNLITNEGKNCILNTMFDSVTAKLNRWNVGLVNGADSPVPAVGDTYSNIGQSGNAWTEFTDYDEATRLQWQMGAASGQAITTSTPAVFTASGTGSVYGLFVCAGANSATKADHTTGTGYCLWNVVQFSTGPVPVVDGDQLRASYTVRA